MEAKVPTFPFKTSFAFFFSGGRKTIYLFVLLTCRTLQPEVSSQWEAFLPFRFARPAQATAAQSPLSELSLLEEPEKLAHY